MIDKQSFAKMRKELEQADNLREKLIKQARDVLKLSKKAIYSIHRNDVKTADQQLSQAKKQIIKLDSVIKKNRELRLSGAYAEALEEFAEASCFLSYITKKKIPTPSQLGIDVTIYLQALCDVVGELVRRAVNEAAKGNSKTALEIKDAVSKIHSELMLFDFRNIPVRRKFDSIKYGLEKLENLALELKLRRK